MQAEDECNNSKQKETAEQIDYRCSQIIAWLFTMADTSDWGGLGDYCLQGKKITAKFSNKMILFAMGYRHRDTQATLTGLSILRPYRP